MVSGFSGMKKQKKSFVETRRGMLRFAIIVPLLIISTPGFAFPGAYVQAEGSIEPLVSPDLDTVPDFDLSIDAEGNLYALNPLSGVVTVYGPHGAFLSRMDLHLPTDGATSNAVMWIQGKKIYTKQAGIDSIWVFDTRGVMEKRIDLTVRDAEHVDFTDFVVDSRGYIYLLENGSLELEIFDPDGTYRSVFVGSNMGTNSLPGWPESVFLDNEGNFYLTVRTDDSGDGVIVKYSFQGKKLLTYSHGSGVRHYRNVWVDANHNVYAAVPDQALAAKFDGLGKEICEFAADCAAGIAAGSDGTVYLSSKKIPAIGRYFPAQIIELIDLGNSASSRRLLDQAEEYLIRAMTLDNQLGYIHSALGEVLFHQRRWTAAMAEFKYLGDDRRYSQTLTKLRAELISEYWALIPAAILGLLLIIFVTAPLLRKTARIPGFSAVRVIWHPLSTLEKETARTSPVLSVVLILLFAMSSYESWYFTNPIFAPGRHVFSVPIFMRDLAVSGAFVLIWSLVAYKVGELFHGLARYPQLLAGTALCMVPLIIGNPLMALLSHVLTIGEISAYQGVRTVCVVWTALLALASIKYGEGFGWGRALGVGLLIAAATGLTLVMGGFLLGVNQQLTSFLGDLFNEIYTRIAY
jgi:hypothetical protein